MSLVGWTAPNGAVVVADREACTSRHLRAIDFDMPPKPNTRCKTDYLYHPSGEGFATYGNAQLVPPKPGPAPINMTDTYTTAEGYPHRVLCIDSGDAEWPVVVVDSVGVTSRRRADGTTHNPKWNLVKAPKVETYNQGKFSVTTTDGKLTRATVIPPAPTVYYHNIYSRGVGPGDAHRTLEQARNISDTSSTKIGIVKVTDGREVEIVE